MKFDRSCSYSKIAILMNSTSGQRQSILPNELHFQISNLLPLAVLAGKFDSIFNWIGALNSSAKPQNIFLCRCYVFELFSTTYENNVNFWIFYKLDDGFLIKLRLVEKIIPKFRWNSRIENKFPNFHLISHNSHHWWCRLKYLKGANSEQTQLDSSLRSSRTNVHNFNFNIHVASSHSRSLLVKLFACSCARSHNQGDTSICMSRLALLSLLQCSNS